MSDRTSKQLARHAGELALAMADFAERVSNPLRLAGVILGRIARNEEDSAREPRKLRRDGGVRRPKPSRTPTRVDRERARRVAARLGVAMEIPNDE